MATPKKLRISLRVLSEAASALKKQIAELPESTKREIARAAGRPGTGGGGLVRGTMLVAAVEHMLTQFERWVRHSLAQAPSVRRGRRRDDDRVWLVAQIGSVYEHYTGLPFNRRSKGIATPIDLVKHVLASADPGYPQTPHNVEKLMRRAIAELRGWPKVPVART